MTTVNTFIKDPQATLDYRVDWTLWLGDDTIEASEWTVPAGLSNLDESFDDLTATVWLAGGEANQQYTVVNEIRTAGGRIDDRTIVIQVAEK